MSIYDFTERYAWLSESYPCCIEYNDIKFSNLLQAFAACRFKSKRMQEACRYHDIETLNYFIDKVTKGPLVIDDFNRREYELLVFLVGQKFTNVDLRKKLLETEGHNIVYVRKGSRVLGEYKGVGGNYLGLAIMEVRRNLLQNLGGNCSGKYRESRKVNEVSKGGKKG